MPIYDITEVTKCSREENTSFSEEKIDAGMGSHRANVTKEKSSLFASILSRLFFLALFLIDLGWGTYSLILLILGSVGKCLTLGRVVRFAKWQTKGWVSLKRALVCSLALVAAICNPAFGIMIACTYFLMYDRNGIEEVIPASLQDQFRDFFNP